MVYPTAVSGGPNWRQRTPGDPVPSLRTLGVRKPPRGQVSAQRMANPAQVGPMGSRATVLRPQQDHLWFSERPTRQMGVNQNLRTISIWIRCTVARCNHRRLLKLLTWFSMDSGWSLTNLLGAFLELISWPCHHLNSTFSCVSSPVSPQLLNSYRDDEYTRISPTPGCVRCCVRVWRVCKHRADGSAGEAGSAPGGGWAARKPVEASSEYQPRRPPLTSVSYTKLRSGAEA